MNAEINDNHYKTTYHLELQLVQFPTSINVNQCFNEKCD